MFVAHSGRVFCALVRMVKCVVGDVSFPVKRFATFLDDGFQTFHPPQKIDSTSATFCIFVSVQILFVLLVFEEVVGMLWGSLSHVFCYLKKC
jgi:hypothetical protein